MLYTQASVILKKLGRNFLHNKLQYFVIVALWILFALSIIAILNRIGIVDYFLGYSSNAEKINEVFYNLSYSYLAGLIFYLVNDWVPRHFREINARRSLSFEINQLKSSLDEIHRIIIFAIQNKENLLIRDLGTSEDPFSGSIWCKYRGPHSEELIRQIDIQKQISSNASDALNTLNKLIRSPLFSDLNRSLANILINLQSNQLLTSANNISIGLTTEDFEKLYLQFEDKMYIQTNLYEYSVPTPYECDCEKAKQLIK